MHEVRPRTRVLLTTEGTYPHELGGVSSWCDLLIRELAEFDWLVLPIIAPHGRTPLFTLPDNARGLPPIEVWSQQRPPKARRGSRPGALAVLPAVLVRELLGWGGDVEAVVDAWVSCRQAPGEVRRAFRSAHGWSAFQDALAAVLGERVPEAGTPPAMDLVEAAELYQTLYWIARTAAAPTPDSDVLLATAAGWSSVPAAVHRALHGTPMILTEHGVFVRETYLAAVRREQSPGRRFATTRLARGLTRTAYACADVIAPVTDANAYWERGLGVDPGKIRVVYNGLRHAHQPTPPPGTGTVVAVGRIDPLKDIHTMLRAAAATLELVPGARFEHYGSVTPGEEAYGRSCELLHAQLGLGDRFRFMGRTSDPAGVVRAADVVLMTSISEGLPLALLEAMSEARPIVATRVGGVPDVVRGCGIVTTPVDDEGIAIALATLLRRPALAARLGAIGHQRLGRRFTQTACIDGYRELLRTAGRPAVPAAPVAAPLGGRGMSAMLVEARLGRKPQDMLEAAVVLEAWGGVPPAQALQAGSALMPRLPAAPLPSAGQLPAAAPRPRVRLEAAAFAASAMAVAVWAAPLHADLGGPALRRALVVALPLTLALQWTISSRYLSPPGGLAALCRRRLALALGAAALVAALGASLGTSGLLAGLLTVAWTGGAILTRRGQPLLYAGAMAAATPPLLAGAPPIAVLAALDLAIALIFSFTRRPDGEGSPGAWSRALQAGAIGAALGVLVVSDRSVSWTSRPAEVLLLVPSILAGVWGSAHLVRLVREIPAALVGTPLQVRPGARTLRSVAGALLRVAFVCALLSAVAALVVPWPASSTAGALAGFGLLALVTMLASLLESFGRSGRTLAAIVAGIAVEWLAPGVFAGAGLVAGSGLVLVALLALVAAVLRRPATLVATTLWIT